MLLIKKMGVLGVAICETWFKTRCGSILLSSILLYFHFILCNKMFHVFWKKGKKVEYILPIYKYSHFLACATIVNLPLVVPSKVRSN